MVGVGRVVYKGFMVSFCFGYLWFLLVWVCFLEGWVLGGGVGRRGVWCVV